jgi:hypothetical protein
MCRNDIRDSLAGGDDSLGEPLERLDVVEPGGLHLRHRRDGRGRCELAGRVTAHAVGDDEQLVAGVAGVLVAGAYEADVRPTLICWPTASGVGPEMRERSTQVPFVEPRSLTTQVPFSSVTFECLLLA